MARSQEDPENRAESGASYWFGPFRYDQALASLRRGEEEIPLPPRALALLEYLLERPGVVVSKDELLEAVWGGRIVGEESLTQAISVIRQALADDPQDPTYIRTVPRRGYLFLSEVRTEPQASAGERSPVRRWLMVGGAFGLLALGAGYWLTQQREPLGPASSQGEELSADVVERATIAVLPFENLGPAEDAYFAAGFTEEVTSRLASVSSLGVISGKSARHYSARDHDLSEVGREFGVDYVLEGAVRWAKSDEGPDRVRITPRLIRVEDDTHLWAKVYDRELKDVFAVQTEIASMVLAELGVQLEAEERAVIDAEPTANTDAYHAYLRAREIHNLLGDFGEAADLFQRATRLDPDFADAYAYYSVVKGDRYRRGVERTPADLIAVQEAIERAVALAPERPAVRLAQGTYYAQCEQDYERAVQLFESLAEDFPNLANVQKGAGRAYQYLGRIEESVSHYERARVLEPNEAAHSRVLADLYRGLRRFDAAEERWNQSLASSPNSGFLYARKALSLLSWRGDLAGARELVSTSPPDFEGTIVMAAIELAEGNYRAAIAVLRRALANPSGLEGPWQEVRVRFRIAFALRLEGRLDAAHAELESLEIMLEGLLEKQPESDLYLRILATVYALEDRGEEAIQLAGRAVELKAHDEWFGPRTEESLLFVYAWTGRTEAARDLAERLLSIPYWHSLTPSRLEVEAEWIPLRDAPGFQELLERHR